MNSNTELFKQINLLAVHIEQMLCVVFSATIHISALTGMNPPNYIRFKVERSN